MEQNHKNELIHAWVGNYILSALTTAIDGCFNGKKAKSKYIEKPIQLFELTEEEKAEAAIKARQQFVAWANHATKKYAKKGE